MCLWVLCHKDRAAVFIRKDRGLIGPDLLGNLDDILFIEGDEGSEYRKGTDFVGGNEGCEGLGCVLADALAGNESVASVLICEMLCDPHHISAHDYGQLVMGAVLIDGKLDVGKVDDVEIDGSGICGDDLRKVNPSGKLPMTFPINYMDIPSSWNFPYYWDMTKGRKGERENVDYTKYDEGIFVGYRYFQTDNREVSYPFGYGLSYTTFSYTKPTVKADKDGFTATITIKNTGKVAGREVVELYVSAPSGGLEKPARELKAFAKTKLLAPGESETLTMKVSAYEMASFNEATSSWETAAGTYQVQFGASVEDIRATASFRFGKAQAWKVQDVLGVPTE